MANTSKTGLIASVRIPLLPEDLPKQVKPELRPFARPAPVVLRPFAGIYNPFPYGCSVLCNHPADLEARDVLRRAKDTWTSEGKTIEEMELLRASMNDKYGRPSFMNAPVPTDDWVPEELFRKYTETDSRPATPAPTLASINTKASNRRCLTPDPSAKEKTLLVLDLRRSHSQETLSWRGMVAPVPLLPPPAPTPRWRTQQQLQYQQARLAALQKRRVPSSPQRSRSRRSNKSSTEQSTPAVPETPAPVAPIIITEESADLSPPTPRRRGLRRRGRRSKKLRDGAQSPEKEFKGLDEPGETQISTLGDERVGSATSATHGLVGEIMNDVTMETEIPHEVETNDQQPPHVSFLQPSILQQLQRQLDWQDVEAEFDIKRHTALKEAMKAPKLRPGCSEIKQLAAELDLTPSHPELWVSVPRSFTRRSARFELPIDSRLLAAMTPLQYCKQYVRVSAARKLLYNGVFNRHREDSGMENEPRSMKAQNVPVALNEVMGNKLNNEQVSLLEELFGTDWCGNPLDFRTFCGIAAVCERVVGSKTGLLPPILQDPRQEVEVADFESISRRLNVVKNPLSTLPKLLHSIHNA